MGRAPGAPPRPPIPHTLTVLINPDHVALAIPNQPVLPESAVMHMLHRGAVQPNNASEHEFWPAVNRNEVELEEAALVESRKRAY